MYKVLSLYNEKMIAKENKLQVLENLTVLRNLEKKKRMTLIKNSKHYETLKVKRVQTEILGH